MKGLVIKSTGSLCSVLGIDGENYPCKIKGKNRLLNIEFTNPVAVGDQVVFTFDAINKTGLIQSVEPRKNYLIRKSVNLSHKSQIIAANIDLALLMVTVKNPITSLNFIDRFLVQTEAYGINTKLIFNKIDLHDEKLEAVQDKYQTIYQNIGYETISMSMHDDEKLKYIKKILKNKITVITGHSGVGKSTLINLIEPNLNLKTNTISEYHKQGVHTTTYTEMYKLKLGGYIIDTPGIKGLGLVNLDINLLSRYFPEMLLSAVNCKFKNCTHVNEPGCNVILQLTNNLIATSRYESYLSMLKKNTNYRQTNY